MEALFLAGIIAAAVVGTANFIDYIVENNTAIDELEHQQENLETQYEDQKSILTEQKAETDRNATIAWEQSTEKLNLEKKQAQENLDNAYNQNVKNTTLEFETNKKEAFHNADVSDKEQTFNEWVYSNELNNQLNLLNKSQKLSADNYNQASISIGQNTGNALSAAAASGTRTSSMNQAIELEQAANYQTLQLNQDYNRAGVANSYQSLLLQGAQQNFNIQQNRDAANYLRNSYLEGGSNFNLYQNALADLQTNYNLASTHLSETNNINLKQINQNYYNTLDQNQRMFTIKNQQMQHNYEIADASIQRQLDDKQDVWKNIIRGSTALVNGSVAGWNTGTKVYSTANSYFGS